MREARPVGPRHDPLQIALDLHRVLLPGEAEAVETPIGLLPAAGSLDLDGLEISQADLDLLLTVDRQAWKLEADQIPEFFRGFGDHLPARLRELQQDLIDRLG